MDNDESLSRLRQSGDIDVWIEGGRERVIKLVQSLSPTREIRETHAQLNLFKDTEVEAHYRPGLMRNFWTNRTLQRFFIDNADKCFSNRTELFGGYKVCLPIWKFNVVHKLSHMHHHLFAGGVGMRQVMDYYFVLSSRNASDEEKKSLMLVISECGMNRFVAAIMWIMEYIFGLGKDSLICKPCEKDGRFLLDEIMKSGNFGYDDERIKKFNTNSYIQNFVSTIVRNLHIVRFAPLDWIMSPLWRIYYFCWRKNGYA